MRRLFPTIPLLLLLIPGLAAQIPGSEGATHLPGWNFMSLSTARVDTFLRANPSYDGRGVTVVIFDTGIDPSIPGLGTTTLGTRKVVDLVDLSGSNVVSFTEAKKKGSRVEGETITLELGDRAGEFPSDDLWIGQIDERRFRNASVRDFDGDGKSESLFPLLLFRRDSRWLVAVDDDADGRLGDGPVLSDYRLDGTTLLFRQTDSSTSPLSAGLSIDPAARQVTLHYDMDGHGTHVAGIAAGRAIGGEEGFDGVAPGAELISVKFSSDPDESLTITNTMADAYRWAARLADSLETVGRPVVVNMSFGIGSSYEGRATIEQMLDTLIAAHPNLYVVTSAGNEGPGISTVGIPAAAALPISVGAALPKGIGRDAYGAAIDRDILWDFSSRGGEVDKPDVVAPGTAISTVPRFSFDMRASGTSMASPYTAGVVALLLSAAAQEYPGWVPGQGLIRRLLRTSATPLDGYAAIEQGGGMIDVIAAWERLKRWKRSGYADAFQEYVISTDSPGYPDGTGPTAFRRYGGTIDPDQRQSFEISRRAMKAYPIEEESFFRAYRLESTADWIEPIQGTVHIRGNGSTTVDLLYDPEKLAEPGLYSGRVIARRERGRRATASDEIEFELLSTVIVPHRLSASDNFTIATEPRTILPGQTDRHFVALPSGALGLRMRLVGAPDSKGTIGATIVDATGRTATWLPRIDPRERTVASALVDAATLGDGLVEIVVEGEAFEGAGGAGRYWLEIEGVMLDLGIEAMRLPDGTDDLRVTARNVGTEVIEGRLATTVKGYERILVDTLRDPSIPYRRAVTITPYDGALWIAVEFSPEDYMRGTDILLRLLDSTGLAQGTEVFHGPSEWVFLPNFDRGGEARTFTLEVVFGAASRDEVIADPIPFRIVERHVRPTDFRTIGSGRQDRTFYPFLPRTITTTLPTLDGGIPSGFYPIGELRFRPEGQDDEEVVIEFPVR